RRRGGGGPPDGFSDQNPSSHCPAAGASKGMVSTVVPPTPRAPPSKVGPPALGEQTDLMSGFDPNPEGLHHGPSTFESPKNRMNSSTSVPGMIFPVFVIPWMSRYSGVNPGF